MSVEPIGLLTLAIGLATLFWGADLAILCFIPMTLLGSAGAILLGASGTIQPAHLMLSFLTFTIFLRPERRATILRSSTFPHECFWLAAIVILGVIGGLLLPRVFAGATDVTAIGSTDYGPSVVLVPLGPTSGNITQAVYIIADFACFAAVLAYASVPRDHAVVVKALLIYCVGDVAFAFLDVVTSATGTSDLLGFIRNASYVFHDDEVTGGLRRIIGSFTETSAFSSTSIGCLGFTARLWLAGLRPRVTATLSVVFLGLLAFSTSTTAYAAAPGLLIILYGAACLRIVGQGLAPPATYAFLCLTPLALILVAIGISLNQTAYDVLQDFLAVTVLDKSTSQSGIERAQWNQTALQSFFDTFGFGGGLGSIRASSFPLAVLSNLGLVGAMGFLVFFAIVLLPGRHQNQTGYAAEVRAAARMACIGLLLAATVSGALVDLGLPFYVFAAVACATPDRRGAQNPVSLQTSLVAVQS